MRFDIITIFPNIFDSYFNESILKRAQVARPVKGRHPGLKGLGTKKLVQIFVHDLRKWTRDKHRKVDDTPYGGGAGMVLQMEPIARAVEEIKSKIKNQKSKLQSKKQKEKIVLLSPVGKQFTQTMAREWAKKYPRLILVAGHYEGVDERVKKIFPLEEVSIGPYVLTGGELAAMVIVDAVVRHIPGVLGKVESLEERRYGVGVPVYTRPEVFLWKGKKYRVPMVLLSGDHKKIEAWRRAHRRGEARRGRENKGVARA